jgi:hypothetical protein
VQFVALSDEAHGIVARLADHYDQRAVA